MSVSHVNDADLARMKAEHPRRLAACRALASICRAGLPHGVGAGGWLASVRIRQSTASRFATFVELEGKTAGWVAGNVNLERNVSVRVGGSVRLY